MKALFLGIDQGTRSSRALLFDEQGNQVASARQVVDLNRFDDGRVEQDANQLVSSVKNVIKKVLDSLDDTDHVVACGLATQRSTVLNWASDGTVNGAALSWQDVRGSDLIKTLSGDEPEIKKLSGLPLSAHYGASKMRWLLDNLPLRISSSKENRLSPLVSFLLYHLVEGGPYLVDHSNAQRTQLMDINTLKWSQRLTTLFGLPENLLPVCSPLCADYGVLSESGIPVTAVCGDQNAAMFGVGTIYKSTALVNIGSGAFILRKLSSNSESENQLTGIAYSDNETIHYLREATINGAGSALNWVVEKYNIKQIDERVDDWLSSIDNPPLFINTVGGLGSPWWRQGIEPEFIDAALNDEGALVVAVLESIIFMIRVNLDLMVQEQPVNNLRVSGGLSVMDGLCQKLSNLCNLPVDRVMNPESTARGVAWLAAGSPDEWNQTVAKEMFTPVADEALNERYAKTMEILNQKLAVQL